ncbi:TPA: transporter [Legionella pneumophila]|nr:transporter [Legionella pneumophila]HAU0992165.1 transporter [Legionella pneumophila]HAU1107101.1 transporter [Legionella pneumophila]HAU1483886.1 transporter [Legionella pneumophila]HAU1499855.1 transporter [Legionella pneumophila]
MNQITKYFNKKAIGLFNLFVVLLFLLSPAYAAANHEEEAQTIPTTIPAIWEAIDEHAAAINKALANNQLSTIHQHAFAIRDLVKALPGLSKNLSEEQLKNLQLNVGYTEQLAKRLDKTGDANDKKGTVANWQKLQKVLTLIRANYAPSGS